LRVTKRLAIIAGKGRMPLDVAHAAADDGYMPLVMPINGQADADFTAFETAPIRLGAIGTTRSLLRDRGIDQLVLAGKVEWPSLRDLRPDRDGVKLLGKMLTRGDDKVLRLLKDYFAAQGIAIIGVDRFMPSRVMTEGLKAGNPLSPVAVAAIAHGRAVLVALGDQDVGQSVVVQAGRVLAIEAAEGTDQMLKRVKDLIKPDDGPTVFVKMRKCAQDRDLDRPVVGCATIEAAAGSGINLCAIEAGGVVLSDDIDHLVASCQRLGVGLIGFNSTAP
jgi:DUF1009 family protein